MKTIYIDIDEEITSVIDRIRKITDREIILVIPQRALLSQSFINLKLLKSQGDILGRKIIIVTADQLGKHLATRAGLEVREKVGNQAVLTTEIEKPQETKRGSLIPQREDWRQSSPRAASPFLSPDGVAAVSVSDIIRRAKSNKFYPLRQDSSSRRTSLADPRRRSSPAESDSSRPPDPSPERGYRGQVKKRSKRKTIRLSSLSAKVGLGFIGFSIFLILVIIFLILPKATVTIVPKSEPLSENVSLVVQVDATATDNLKEGIGGRIITLEKQERRIFKPTGKKQALEKARGEVILYNELGVSQLLVPTTRLMSQGNILFRTESQVVIPPASVSVEGKVIPGSVKGRVVADQAGPEGNIGPSDFYIVAFSPAKREKIYAKSSDPFVGGVSRDIEVVTQKDLDEAQRVITESLVSSARAEINNNLPAGFTLSEGALVSDVSEVKHSKKVDEEADTFETVVKIQMKALIFPQEEARDAALRAVSSLLGTDKYILNFSEEGVNYKLENVDLDGKKALMTVHIEKEVFWKIDEGKIKAKIVNLNEEGALKYLQSLAEVRQVEIRLWPFWVRKVPALEKKIEVQVLDALP